MVQGVIGRLVAAWVVWCAAVVGVALGDQPPEVPVITEPAPGSVLNGADVHMETGPFLDADAGDGHVCTDWEVWTVSPSARVWATLCIDGVERLHTHLGDGVFEGSHADLHELLPSTQYVLRVRHRSSGGGGIWSEWAERPFATGASSVVFPLEVDDVRELPAPAWTDGTGRAVVLPAVVSGGVAARLELGGGHEGAVLTISGLDGIGNQVENPAGHGAHHPLWVMVSAASGAGAVGLLLPETTVTFTDGGGVPRTVYLPPLQLAAGGSVLMWVSSNGSTYTGQAGQALPDFSTLARGVPVPWTVVQPGYKVEVVARGMEMPVNIAFVGSPGAGADAPLYYVAELYGTIKVVRRNGVVSDYATGLLNFNPTGNFPGSGEQGVAGLAVHPTTGDVYASMVYSSVSGVEDVPHYPKVVRFTSVDGGLTAATQTTILNMVGESMGQSHQISNVSFGPDGFLYVHVGDGFVASTAQNLASYRGKILRMTAGGGAVATNPFYNAGDGITARDYVFAYGFRNPFGGAWRASDGRHYEVENGPSVDRVCQVVAGRNYLWNGSDASMGNFAIYNWNPATGPVNMAFVQSGTFGGSGFPASMQDKMFISESGPTWASGPQNNGKRITYFELDGAGNRVTGPTRLVEYNGVGKGTAVALAAGPDGLYFSDFYKDVDFVSPIDRGSNILRVRFVGSADFSAATTTGAAPLSVAFTNTSTAPGQTGWAWEFGDGGSSTLANPTHVYQQEGVYTVRLTVTGSAGVSVEEKAGYIRVGNPPRIAMIAVSPPNASDSALAAHLRGKGFTVDVLADAPGSRPTAGQIAAAYQGVVVSSSVGSANVAGEFRTAGVPMVFYESALLRSGRESLMDNGAVVGGMTSVNVLDTGHPITAGMSLGSVAVYGAASNMSVGTGVAGPGTRVLARRAGSATDAAVMVAEAGATVAGGYVTPARRVFLFLEDGTWAQTTAAGKGLVERSVLWAMNVSGPGVVSITPSQTVCEGDAAVLAVAVSGTGPFAYQWRRNGQAIAGGTGPTLTVGNAQTASGGSFSCVVTGIGGSVTAGPTVLTVGCGCGESDIGRTGGVAGADGLLDSNDFIVFIDRFFAGAPSADVGRQGGVAGTDGLLNNNDFVVFIDRFFAGC